MFWPQIKSLEIQNVQFFPFVYLIYFCIIKPFSWIMNAGFSSEKRCATSMTGSQSCRGFKVHDLITKVQGVVALGRHWVLFALGRHWVLFALRRHWVLFALGRHWVLTNGTWHVLLQSENVFKLGGITISFGFPTYLQTFFWTGSYLPASD